jgi:hypothetical protein
MEFQTGHPPMCWQRERKPDSDRLPELRTKELVHNNPPEQALLYHPNKLWQPPVQPMCQPEQ